MLGLGLFAGSLSDLWSVTTVLGLGLFAGSWSDLWSVTTMLGLGLFAGSSSDLRLVTTVLGLELRGRSCRAHWGRLLRVWRLEEAQVGCMHWMESGLGAPAGQSKVAAKLTDSTDLVSPAWGQLGGDLSQGSVVPTSTSILGDSSLDPRLSSPHPEVSHFSSPQMLLPVLGLSELGEPALLSGTQPLLGFTARRCAPPLPASMSHSGEPGMGQGPLAPRDGGEGASAAETSLPILNCHTWVGACLFRVCALPISPVVASLAPWS